MSAYVADPNAVQFVRLFLDACHAEAQRAGCGVLLLAHSTKRARRAKSSSWCVATRCWPSAAASAANGCCRPPRSTWSASGKEVRRRTKKPLLQDQIALKVGRVVGRYKMAKHFRTTIEDNLLEYSRDQASIERERQLDGLYIVRTSQTEMAAEEAVRSYKQLTRVEKAFRCLKSVDLHVRPIHHRREGRVRAHLLLCLLAYYVEWHLRVALAELLYQHEDLEGWQGQRDPVQAAEPPKDLSKKKGSGTSKTGLPLHSFRTLMAEMGTRTRNECRVSRDPEGPLVTRIAEATQLQQRVLDLWQVFPVTNTAGKVAKGGEAGEPSNSDKPDRKAGTEGRGG